MASIFRETYQHLPPPAETLAILVGCMELTVFGLGGLANPLEFSKGYGLPITSSSASSQQHPGALEASPKDNEQTGDAKKTQEALIAAIAARNLQNGVLLLAFGLYTRDRRALGIAVATGFITTVADALIVQWYGVKEAVWGHVFGVVNSAAIGGSLLYWARGDKLW